MNKQDKLEALERAGKVLQSIDKDEQEQKRRAQASILPYPIYWLCNLGVTNEPAGGLPRYLSIFILLQIILLFIPDSLWANMGINGREAVADYPEFIQYYVINSAFPNSMYVFWTYGAIVLPLNLLLCLHHVHGKGYSNYFKRRELLHSQRSRFTFITQLIFLIALIAWMIISNLEPPGFLRGFVPLNNKLAAMLFYGIQLSLILPLVVTLVTAELRAEYIRSVKTNKNN